MTTTRTSKGTAEHRTVKVGAPVQTYLVFRVESVWLAVPAELVDEISDTPDVTPVPLVPDHIPGVMNLRGHAVPLLNLSRFLGLDPEDRGDDSEGVHSFKRVAVVCAGGMRVGLLCDRVRGVVEIPAAAHRNPAVVQGRRIVEFAVAEVQHDGGILVLLELERLLMSARVQK